MYSFSARHGRVIKMDNFWDTYRRNSKGWVNDPIARIHTKIHLGSHLNVDITTFNERNITHVVNCAEDRWCPRWFKLEFPERYACIDAVDSPDVDITAWYSYFSEKMNEFLRDPECTGIYVHCQAGINRSAFLSMIFLCLKFGYTIDQSFKVIAMQRPCTFTNLSFRKQVIDYIKKHQ